MDKLENKKVQSYRKQKANRVLWKKALLKQAQIGN